MIRIDRASVSTPASLETGKVRRAENAASDFYSATDRARAQRRHRFSAQLYASADVKESLTKLFHGKCAFCETPVTAHGIADVSHFRPLCEAINLDGSVSYQHYWWLAYEWSNLYLSCGRCAWMKGTRFPVERRATVLDRGERLDREECLLLDPCRDDPLEHLQFEDDGTLVGRTRRGKITADVLGLNREDLVSAREESAQEVRRAWEPLFLGDTSVASNFSAIIAKDKPHTAMRRQCFLRLAFGETAAKLPEAIARVIVPLAERCRADVECRKAGRSRAQKPTTRASVRPKPTRARRRSVLKNKNYYDHVQYIERVEFRNFKGFREFSLRLAQVGPQGAGWSVLLGENGIGKSSILQGVALALMGEKRCNELNMDVRSFVRRRCKAGFVKVYLVQRDEPIELRISRDSAKFHGSIHDPELLLLAYGATRLLPRAGAAKLKTEQNMRVVNLFNPFQPLNDADKWLLALPKAKFDRVARALKDLFQLEDDVVITRKPNQVLVQALGQQVTLKELSDGYQSVLALATDIMQVLLNMWPSMDIAEGVVLLDEIGVHLHPRWRMRIVKSLRNTFPRVQFLATTHEPLCLRGLVNGEVIVLRRDATGQTYAVDDLPSVAALRVDQLLTSEYFGLNSVIDPELDARFVEYYDLLSRRELSQHDKQRLESLKSVLSKYEVLGTTRRERLMYEAIDRYLAEEPHIADDDARLERKHVTEEHLSLLWKEALPPSHSNDSR